MNLLTTKIINDKYDNVKFTLIGDIIKNNNLYIDINFIKKQNHINYLGYKNNIYDYLVNSDCIILPSYREGVPRTLIEAASIGLPIISTNVPGCRDICINKYNGFQCKSQSVTDLVSKIELFMKYIDDKINMDK